MATWKGGTGWAQQKPHPHGPKQYLLVLTLLEPRQFYFRGKTCVRKYEMCVAQGGISEKTHAQIL